jgi:hypothetical protein
MNLPIQGPVDPKDDTFYKAQFCSIKKSVRMTIKKSVVILLNVDSAESEHGGRICPPAMTP